MSINNPVGRTSELENAIEWLCLSGMLTFGMIGL